MKKFLAPCIIMFMSCNTGNEKPEGGPCTYETKIYAATVIAIDKVDSLQAEIIFNVADATGNLYRDSVSWRLENGNFISDSTIRKENVSVGKKYKYSVDRIVIGDCNSPIEKLTLIEY